MDAIFSRVTVEVPVVIVLVRFGESCKIPASGRVSNHAQDGDCAGGVAYWAMGGGTARGAPPVKEKEE